MPFLHEDEWEKIEDALPVSLDEIMRLGKGHPSLDIAASQIFESITGIPSIPRDVIYHHRLQDYGPPCAKCGHLLRTPQATFCANCGKYQ